MIIVATFYKFFDNQKNFETRLSIKQYADSIGLRGIIIVASEGMNGTISGSREGINNFFTYLKKEYHINFDNIKESFVDYHPFKKMKVKAKKEIVTLKIPGVDGSKCGKYVEPKEWDDFISRDDVVLIDTRNDYEIKFGSFKSAINPETENFSDFPSWFEKHKNEFSGKKIAMCCTGGVRCEKSTAYLKTLNFQNVYHLKGGILKYLEDIGSSEKSTWFGSCFVFDQRTAVDKKISPISLSKAN